MVFLKSEMLLVFKRGLRFGKGRCGNVVVLGVLLDFEVYRL